MAKQKELFAARAARPRNIVTATELARFMGLTPRRVQQFRDEGLVHCGTRGKTCYYDLVDVFAFIQGRARGVKGSERENRAAYFGAMARAKDLEVAQLEGELCHESVVVEFVQSFGAIVKGAHDALIARLTHVLTDQAAGELETELRATDAALADAASDWGARRGRVAPDAKKKHRRVVKRVSRTAA